MPCCVFCPGRDGDELRAFPSIAKVAREAFDPQHQDCKGALINNITTSSKETAQVGEGKREVGGCVHACCRGQGRGPLSFF